MPYKCEILIKTYIIMSTEEVLRDWKKFFFLILESLEDDSYKNAEKIINDADLKEVESDFIAGLLDFRSLIGIFISIIIVNSVGCEKLSDQDLDNTFNRINDFWVRYLKNPTKKFTAKRGLSPINCDTLDVAFLIKKYK